MGMCFFFSVHNCRAWHKPVHARVHSLTLRCVKSERWCWQTAEHLVSKCSPWPPSSATVSAWNKLFLIWTGIMYSQSSEVLPALCSRDKNKYGNRGRCDTRVLPEKKRQQVSGGIAWTSQICYLVWGMLADSWDSTSEACFFSPSFFFLTAEQSSQRRLPLIAEILKSALQSIWRELGLTCSCLKKKKRDMILDKNADHDQRATNPATEAL